jgi:gamma-glutamylaminecyclotransferase
VITIFVYGSLLSGERNHRVLEGARLIGEARTAPSFSLHDLGSYPAMVADGTYAIVGELYEVDEPTLARLDTFEGHPSYYERCTIRLENGGTAETYLLPRDQAGRAPLIASGDWRQRQKEKRR